MPTPIFNNEAEMRQWVDDTYFDLMKLYAQHEDDIEDCPGTVEDLMHDMAWHIQYLTQIIMEGRIAKP